MLSWNHHVKTKMLPVVSLSLALFPHYTMDGLHYDGEWPIIFFHTTLDTTMESGQSYSFTLLLTTTCTLQLLFGTYLTLHRGYAMPIIFRIISSVSRVAKEW